MKNEILPDDIAALVESEAAGLAFGVVRLEIILRDGHPRWNISRSISIHPGNSTDCSETEEVA